MDGLLQREGEQQETDKKLNDRGRRRKRMEEQGEKDGLLRSICKVLVALEAVIQMQVAVKDLQEIKFNCNMETMKLL